MEFGTSLVDALRALGISSPFAGGDITQVSALLVERTNIISPVWNVHLVVVPAASSLRQVPLAGC